MELEEMLSENPSEAAIEKALESIRSKNADAESKMYRAAEESIRRLKGGDMVKFGITEPLENTLSGYRDKTTLRRGVTVSRRLSEMDKWGSELNKKKMLADSDIIMKVVGINDKDKISSVKITDYHREALRDMVRKAYIMSYIATGKEQVTLANYQKDSEGKDEAVITDINFIIRDNDKMPFADGYHAPFEDNSPMITKSRRNREARFAAILADMQKRR